MSPLLFAAVAAMLAIAVIFEGGTSVPLLAASVIAVSAFAIWRSREADRR